MKVPCIKKNGLKIFSTTADQRALIGEEIFLRTHYPLNFRRYRAQNFIEEWKDHDILKLLTEDNKDNIGNRVFILFGAAGSGKSETIRWIDINARKLSNTRGILRISRTELDPVIILKKLLGIIGAELNKDIILNWEVLKKKPVTLANSLVWNALNSVLDEDNLIVPISYKLRPLIENNIYKSFIKVHTKDQFYTKSIELITIEELQVIIDECALNINLDYEKLRRNLIDRFENEVLGGYSFIKTLQYVGKSIEEKTGERPLLLVDDLVQSMNVYASELLDFFITFEEGNWDIVIGLTPSNFESSKRGRELLTRINYLDTFDDRLFKLWLTDEQGNQSYFLNENNAADYITNYLNEYKRLNGYECGNNCRFYEQCKALHWGEQKDIVLTPLNTHISKRLFKNLFKGKGQARHFVVTAGEYINSIIMKKELDFLKERINRDKFLAIEDPKLKIITESYMPINVPEKLEITKEFCNLFSLDYKENIIAEVTDLIIDNSSTHLLLENSPAIDANPELSAIRDWIEGKNVNKELLKPVRVAFSELFRELSNKNDFKYPYTSRMQSTIKREQVVEGSKVPLAIEGIDHFDGINIRRSLGTIAMTLVSLARNKSANREDLINQILCASDIHTMIEDFNSINNCWRESLEYTLEISCEELAFLLYVFIFNISAINTCPLIINNSYKNNSLGELPHVWSDSVRTVFVNEMEFVENFFKDWFQLRDNFYDGYRLKRYIKKYSKVYYVIGRLATIEPEKLPDEYKVNNISVKHILKELISLATHYKKVLDDKNFKEYCNAAFINIKVLKCMDSSEIDLINQKLLSIQKIFVEMGKLITVPNYDFIQSLYSFKQDIDCKLKYPESIYYIVSNIKSPIYIWFNNVVQFVSHIINEYRFYLRSVGEVHTLDFILGNKDEIDESFLNKATIFELIDIAEEYTKRVKDVHLKLNENQQIMTLVLNVNQGFVDDFYDFLNVFHSLLPSSNYNSKFLLFYKDAIEKYYGYLKDEAKFLNESNKSTIREMIIFLNRTHLQEVKKSICNALINRLTVHITHASICKVNTNAIRKLIDDLSQVSLGERFNYIEISTKIKHEEEEYYNAVMSNVYKERERISPTIKNLLKEIVKGENVQVKINSPEYKILSEVISKSPEISKLIEYSIRINYCSVKDTANC